MDLSSAPPPTDIPHLVIGGVRTACASRADLAEAMVRDCLAARQDASRRPRLVFDTNGHAVSLAARDADYRAALDAADIVHADGGVIVAASRAMGAGAVPERSATTDMIHDAAAAAAEAGLSFYLLGGTEEVNAECCRRLEALYPSLMLAGHRHGYFSDAEEPAICEAINESGADVVWVGLGKPKEQVFSVRNRDRLRAGWLVTCGGCFNFVTGHYARAPGWMQRSGLEWAHRLASDPKKLFWRYATTNPHALYLIAARTPRGQEPRPGTDQSATSEAKVPSVSRFGQ